MDITFVISQSVCPKSNELLRSAEAGLRGADSGTRSDAGELGAQPPKSMRSLSLTGGDQSMQHRDHHELHLRRGASFLRSLSTDSVGIIIMGRIDNDGHRWAHLKTPHS